MDIESLQPELWKENAPFNTEWAHADICYKMVMMEISFCSCLSLLDHREKYGCYPSLCPLPSQYVGKLLQKGFQQGLKQEILFGEHVSQGIKVLRSLSKQVPQQAGTKQAVQHLADLPFAFWFFKRRLNTILKPARCSAASVNNLTKLLRTGNSMRRRLYEKAWFHDKETKAPVVSCSSAPRSPKDGMSRKTHI